MGTANSKLSAEQLKEYQELTFLSKQEIIKVFQRFAEVAGGGFDEDLVGKGVSIETIMQMEEFAVNPFRDRICKVFAFTSGVITFEDFLDMMSVFSDNAPLNVKAEYAFRYSAALGSDNEPITAGTFLKWQFSFATAINDLRVYSKTNYVRSRISLASAATTYWSHISLDRTTPYDIYRRIYDFDEDDMLSRQDMREVVTRLCQGLSAGQSNAVDNNSLTKDEMDDLLDRLFAEGDLDRDGQLSYSEFEHVISKVPDFANSFRIRL